MYIDGLAKLDEHHGITAKLFADDVKVYMVIENNLDAVKLQATLDNMEWSGQTTGSYISTVCQPTRPTHPFILSGTINE